MNKTGIPYLDFGWNPGGCGCSNGCDGCWARVKVAPRVGRINDCDDCKNFRVHFHPERLGDPAKRKKPGKPAKPKPTPAQRLSKIEHCDCSHKGQAE